MLNKVLSSLKRMSGGSDFDSYYQSLSRNGLTGGPTVQEARRDYREALRRELPR